MDADVLKAGAKKAGRKADKRKVVHKTYKALPPLCKECMTWRVALEAVVKSMEEYRRTGWVRSKRMPVVYTHMTYGVVFGRDFPGCLYESRKAALRAARDGVCAMEVVVCSPSGNVRLAPDFLKKLKEMGVSTEGVEV